MREKNKLMLFHACMTTAGGMYFIALPLLALQLGTSASQAAVLIGVGSYPALALSPWLAAHADAGSRRQLLRLSSVLMLFATLSVGGAVYLPGPDLTWLGAAATFISGSLLTHGVGLFSYIAEQANSEEHRRATASYDAISKVASIVGTALGGLIAATGLVVIGLAIATVTVIASVLTLRNKMIPQEPTYRTPAEAFGNALRVISSQGMRKIVLLGFLVVLAFAPASRSFLAAVLVGVQGVSELQVTVIFSVAAILAAVLLQGLNKAVLSSSENMVLIAALAMCALGYGLLFTAGNMILLITVSIMIMQIGSTTVLSLLRAIRHEKAPADSKGGVTVGNDLIMWTGTATGTLAAGQALTVMGIGIYIVFIPLLGLCAIIARTRKPKL
jgi:predicted MFS family arabinose efflux permease